MEKEQQLQSLSGKPDRKQHHSYLLEEKSLIGLIKRDIRKLAEETGLSEEERGKADIIISELGSNLLKHSTKRKEILIRAIEINGQAGLEIIGLDDGPGIHDVNKAMQDGYSTAGTMGEGLGAIKRLSNNFDIYSQPGSGTIILSRVFSKKISLIKPAASYFDYGSIMLPKPGEEVCGDNWFIGERGNLCAILVADGLGHGPFAYQASKQATITFKSSWRKFSPSQTLEDIHFDLKKTRGAVASVAMIDSSKNSILYCGVGNISCRVYGFDGYKTFMSFNGILGLNTSRINNSEFSWDRNKTLIMHSDGLKTKWDLNIYPQLLTHDPSLIAALLYRDYSRKTDDVSIVVVKTKRKI